MKVKTINSNGKKIKIQRSINFGKTNSEKVLIWVAFTIFFIHAVSLLLPIVWGIISSFKDGPIEYFSNIFGLPKVWMFSNYPDAVKVLEVNGVGFFEMAFNSVWWSFGSSFLFVMVLCLTSYVFARYEFPCKKLLFTFSVFLMIIPTYGMLPAQYDLYGKLGLKNSPLLLLTALGCFGQNQFLVMTSFFRGLSKEYKDAAFIDGAEDFITFFKIMLPQAKGMMMSYFLLTFLSCWNDYYSPILYLDKMPTLASGLFTYQNVVLRMGNYPLYFAGVFITSIPMVILYSFLHKTITENLSFGGLKG